jgi:hypothetical protein
MAIMTPEQIEQFLASEVIVRIGIAAEGRVYIVPMTCVYMEGAMYGFGHEGQKFRMMRANPDVGIEVEKLVDFATWQSVIADGVFEELKGAEAGRYAPVIGQTLMSRITDPEDRRRIEEIGKRSTEPPIVYRVRLTTKSGRYEA